jgi:hypothetical protein
MAPFTRRPTVTFRELWADRDAGVVFMIDVPGNKYEEALGALAIAGSHVLPGRRPARAESRRYSFELMLLISDKMFVVFSQRSKNIHDVSRVDYILLKKTEFRCKKHNIGLK